MPITAKRQNRDLVPGISITGLSIKVPVNAWWRTGAREVTSSYVMKVKLPALKGRTCGALAGQPSIEKKCEWVSP
jgi:hypothetical protein